MQITVKSKPFSLSSKKIILVNNKELYFAKSEVFAIENYFKIFNLKTGFVKAILTRETSILKDSFKIRLLNNDNIELKFKRISIWKHEYEGYYFDDKYEILHPNFEQYSILKNGTTIAYFKKEKKIFEESSKFQLELVDNKNFELIIVFCLFIHIKESEKGSPA